MKFRIIATAALLLGLCGGRAYAGFGDTLPQNIYLLDFGYISSTVTHQWNGFGKLANLTEDIKMYEPTGDLQGTIVAPARNDMRVLVSQLFYGVTDDFTIGLVFPYVISSKTRLNLGWEPGDYNAGLGRRYSGDDFWQWAASMGQHKPSDAKREGLPGDLMIGARYRFYRDEQIQVSLMSYLDTRTGVESNPEVLGSAGSTGYAMGTNGDIGGFLSIDKVFPDEPWKRLTLSANVLYEYQHWRRLRTPKGTKEPLLLTYAPYVGNHYRVKPGDFWGGTLGFSVVSYWGPSEPTWLTEGNPELQAALPGLWTLSAKWIHKRFPASDYRSNSPQWDKDQEAVAGPGFRNTLEARSDFNFMRVGFPGILYFGYTNQEWLQGQNFRPVIGYTAGLTLIFTF